MECIFRVLAKDEKTFEKLQQYASGIGKEKLIIIYAKCDFFEVLKNFNIEILITPHRNGEGVIDCFYYDKEIKECDKKILNKFDMKKYEPIKWRS